MAPSRITIANRIKAIEERLTKTDSEICKKYKVSLRTLQRWAAEYRQLLDVPKSKMVRCTLHNGRKRQKVIETAHLMSQVRNMITTCLGKIILLTVGQSVPALAVTMMRAHPRSFLSFQQTCWWVQKKWPKTVSHFFNSRFRVTDSDEHFVSKHR